MAGQNQPKRLWVFQQGLWLLGLLVVAGVGAGFFWYAHSSSEPPRTGQADPDPDAPSGPLLGEAERSYLWEIEHHGNLLTRVGFLPLAHALTTANEADLRWALAADFTGEVPKEPREVKYQTGLLQVVRQTSAGLPPLAVDGSQFVQRLLDYRRLFHGKVKAKFALMKLAPQKRGVLDGLWQGTCQLRIWGEREAGKPAEVVAYLSYAVRQPTVKNLDKGGWLVSCAITQSQVGTSDRFLMRESAVERGLDPAPLHDNWKVGTTEGASGGVYLCDYDRDGILDMLVTDRNGCFLYKGLPGGRFRDVTEEVGLPRIVERTPRGLVAAWVDIDGDGWEDLILGRWVFKNDQGKRFENMTGISNLRLPEDTGGIAIADFDRDGLPDLYVFHPGKGKADSWLEGKSGDPIGNQLWRNKGNWQFEDVTAKSGTGGGFRSTFTAVWLDANNDGWPDLYVPNEFGDGVLLVNQGNGTFREQRLSDKPCDFGTMGVTCGDVDNDGNIDIYCGNMYSKAGSRVIGNLRPDTYSPEIMAKLRTFVTGSQLHRNKGGLQFEQKGQQWQVADVGWAYGPALVDLDNDGWLDLHALCGYISRSRDKPDG
jgi:hypothetical protein